MADHVRARRLLIAERSELRCLLSGLGYDPSTNGRDSGDAAMANERTEWQARERDRALTKLGDIDVALARIAGGTYGTCSRCAQPIAAARLKAIPEAGECVRCAGLAE